MPRPDHCAKAGWLVLAALLAAAAGPVRAQFKVVAADGSVTYTDRPIAVANSRVSTLSRNGAVQTVDAGLPASLQQVARRYPVVLYTSSDCPPCELGRKLLQSRGVPFAEKRVFTEEDAAALQRAAGGRTLPALLIGSQQLRSYSENDWTSYLDAAGYPRVSQLPRSWQQAAVQPASDKAPPAKPAASAPTPRVDSAPAEATSGNVLRF